MKVPQEHSETAVHCPVLLQQAIEALNIRSDGLYIDATYGRGGHSRAILAKLDDNGQIIVIDKDLEAYQHAQECFSSDPRVRVCHASFTVLENWSSDPGMRGAVAGIVFDLGLSSPQLADGERGFSFMKDGPLDMRMNQTVGNPVTKWLNKARENDITAVLRKYGEERSAARISRAIVKSRPVLHTGQLADIVSNTCKRYARTHPATKTFQALRIFVNRELEELERALQPVPALLKKGGRIVVLSFHSLEDRIVKRFMLEQSTPTKFAKNIPMADDYSTVSLTRPDTCHALQFCTAAERQTNRRARSVRMRVSQKI